LLPLPLLVFYILPGAKKERAAVRVPFFNVVQAIYQHEGLGHVSSKLGKLLLLSFVWLLLVTFAARPQWVGESISLPASGRDLLLAVDISVSMRELSRNRHVGAELAKGRPLQDVLAGMKTVAEGVRTTDAALALAGRYGVELPIAAQVAELLAGRTDARTALEALMLRPQRAEAN
jgi:hypothetical protein